jgi:signal transduction histidine kinase
MGELVSETLQTSFVAAAWAGSVGLVGLAVAFLLRRRSMRLLVALVAVVAVLAVVAGTVGASRAMLISQHDFRVVLQVVVVAGLVGLAVSMAVAAALGHWSRRLQGQARQLDGSGSFEAAERLPSELRAIAEELEQTSTRLAESREREHRLEESRRELVSWVSHDLRSPLAALRAMTEALEDGLADDPERYHAQIRAEVDRMVRMVDDLFELSRIHAGVLRFSPQVVALGDIVSEALAAADPVARALGVRLGGRVEDGLQVNADPAGLSRVVSNLLLNAIRHTPSDGVVEVRGRADGAAVELTVHDACGGLAESEMARVFDVAWQGSSARTPQPGVLAGPGAGLGLAIVKGIVEAHRGQVAVANVDPGCRFVVRLPA